MLLSALSLITKFCLYLGLLGSAGLAIHSTYLKSRHYHLIVTFASLLILATCTRLVLLNAELAGGLGQIFDFETFTWIWHPNKKQSLTYFTGAFCLILFASFKMKLGLTLGAIILFTGVGLGGHTQTLPSPAFNSLVVISHVSFAAFWVTAPIVLWPYKALSNNEVSARLKRFSFIASWIVPLMIFGGLWLSLQLTASFERLLLSEYGQLLLLKLFLASTALIIGALNKYLITTRIDRNPAIGRIWLRRTLIADALLFFIIVIAIAAATTLTGPEA